MSEYIGLSAKIMSKPGSKFVVAVTTSIEWK